MRSEPVAEAVRSENFGKGPGTAGLRTKLTKKDELGTIKPVNLIEDYQKQFLYHDMLEPIMEGKKVSLGSNSCPLFRPLPARFRDMSYHRHPDSGLGCKKMHCMWHVRCLCARIQRFTATITDKDYAGRRSPLFQGIQKISQRHPLEAIRHEHQRN